jgi:hypothetical protein
VSKFDAKSRSNVPIQKGKDGINYFVMTFEIRLTFASASVEYSLWLNDERHGVVTAEYD